MNAELKAKRARLSVVERELSQLGMRHDLAMSAFRFDEARDLSIGSLCSNTNGPS